MYLLIFFNPLITILLLFLFSNHLGYFYFTTTIILSTVITLCALLIIVNEVVRGYTCWVPFHDWFLTESSHLWIELVYDTATCLSLLMVITVSAFVYIYSVEYMYSDPHYMRFMMYLMSFTLFMVILITASNFTQLLLGWEGIGLLSYLLINFWFSRLEANRSALKAMIVNKVGDFALYVAIGLIYYLFKNLDFSLVFLLSHEILRYDFYNFVLFFVCLCLILAAAGKSAQLGLHIWLADAMEGPTPVSALIHAATMVTAGVYLIIRCSLFFELSKLSLIFLLIIGAMTALFSSFIGLGQSDIKKIIAYSTCSQLGYMVIGCGNSVYSLALYHMFIHAFFKALLFLTAGALIYSFNGEQDLRKMQTSIILQPFIYLILFTGSISLVGLPFFSGFYSKELIIFNSFFNIHIMSLFSYILSLITIVCTLIYSMKILYYLKLNYYKNFSYFLLLSNSLKYLVEPKFFMILPLFFLSVFSIVTGYFYSDSFFGPGSDFLSNSINMDNNYDFKNLFIERLPNYIKLSPLVIIFFCYWIHFFFFNHVFTITTMIYFRPIYTFVKYKLYFDILYYLLCELFFFFIYDVLFKLVEKTFFEFFGPIGAASVVGILNTKSEYFNSLGPLLINIATAVIMLFYLFLNLCLTFVIIYMADWNLLILSFLFFYIIK